MRLSISETAKICGVSVRTLHYYDEINLIKPSETSESGYRYYDDETLSLLQQVLFYRELEFSLKDIKLILGNPNYDKKQALKNHREFLLIKKQHLNSLLALVDKTIGGLEMTPKTTLSDIENAKEKYAKEVQERWGSTEAYKESEKKHSSYSSEKEIEIAEAANQIFSDFAQNSDKEPSDDIVQGLVRRWQEHITKYHYSCTKEILSCLADMYVNDERFTENIDRFGDGTAKFMSEAIKIYCKTR